MAINIPPLGETLRLLITKSGYRPAFVDAGLDGDLDGMANESRPGSLCDLMKEAEERWIDEIEKDCGTEWAQLTRFVWFETRKMLQRMALTIDCSALMDLAPGKFSTLFTIPVLSGSLALAARTLPGPETGRWWISPFAAWVEFAARVSGLASDVLVDNLANYLGAAPRTVERWIAGEPLGLLCPPYRTAATRALGSAVAARIGLRNVDRLAGWLMLAAAAQAQPAGLRMVAERAYASRLHFNWSLDGLCRELSRLAVEAGDRPTRSIAVPLMNKIQQAFSRKPFEPQPLRDLLAELDEAISAELPDWQRSYRHIHHWFSARLEAVGGNDQDAHRLYTAAVEGAWWRGGENQHPILNEALLHAVGTGRKVAAEHYWDKVFMLGLNEWPKRTLDIQESRRLLFGFERMFAPKKAVERIPPSVEVLLRTSPYMPTADELSHPNRKIKRADGRTRRTPFMEAIRDGTVEDVRNMIAEGGDSDDFIPESGEGPLIYAMRRACNRKDPEIMNLLLQLSMGTETVNRPASTRRETPLKIAIEMANAQAVERLLALGANPESACDTLPSALCYAMALFFQSANLDSPAQELAYFEGKIKGDAADAKEGAVFDADLAARRRSLASLRNASDRNRRIFEAVRDYMWRKPEEYKKTIEALLRRGADPNRRYNVQNADHAEWTPTLFAAQVGDLGIFKLMISSGGDPAALLTKGSSLQNHDALWIAVGHGNKSIVRFLTEGR
jgi:ankyrin repeat protein